MFELEVAAVVRVVRRAVVGVVAVGVASLSLLLPGVGQRTAGAEAWCPVGSLEINTVPDIHQVCVARFGVTGAVQFVTVPEGVRDVAWFVEGGRGGVGAWSKPTGGAPPNTPANGGRIRVGMAVTPGERFALVVGGAGEGLGFVPDLRGQRVVHGGYGGGGDACAFSYVEDGQTVVTGGGGGGGGSFVFHADGDRSLALAVGGGGGTSGQSGWEYSLETLALFGSGSGGGGGSGSVGGVMEVHPPSVAAEAAATETHPGRGGGFQYHGRDGFLIADGGDGNGPATLGAAGAVGGRGGDGACGGGDRFDPEVVAHGQEAFGGGGGGGGFFGGGGGGEVTRPLRLNPLDSWLDYSGGGSGTIAEGSTGDAQPINNIGDNLNGDGAIAMQYVAPAAPATTTTTTTTISTTSSTSIPRPTQPPVSAVPGSSPSTAVASTVPGAVSTTSTTSTVPASNVPSSTSPVSSTTSPQVAVLDTAIDSDPGSTSGSGAAAPHARPNGSGALARTGAPVGVLSALGALLVAAGVAVLGTRRRMVRSGG